MGQLAMIVAVIKWALIGCVAYSAYSIILFIASFFGGVCIGC